MKTHLIRQYCKGLLLFFLFAVGFSAAQNGTSVGIGTTSKNGTGIGTTPSQKSNQTGIGIGTKTKQPPTQQDFIFLANSASWPKAQSALQHALELSGVGKVTIGSVKPPAYQPLSDDAISAFKDAIRYFSQVYKDPAITQTGKPPNITIDGADDSNLVVSTIRLFFQAMIENLLSLSARITKLRESHKSYFTQIDTLAKEVDAYQQLAPTVKGYVQKNWQILADEFDNRTDSILLGVYETALNDLANRHNVAFKDLSIVEKYVKDAFARWNSSLQIFGFATAKEALHALSTYAQAAINTIKTNVLGSMKPESSVSKLSELFSKDNANRKLLENAQAAMKAAVAVCSYKQSPCESEMANAYNNFFTNLTNALKQMDTIAAMQKTSDQIDSMQGTLIPLLNAGGAAWLAQHLTAISYLFAGDQETSGGEETLQAFVTSQQKNLSQIAQMTFTGDPVTVLNALAKDGATAYGNYQSALEAFRIIRSIISTGLPLISDSQRSHIAVQESIYNKPIINTCATISSALATKLKALNDEESIFGLMAVQEALQQAMPVARRADQNFALLSGGGNAAKMKDVIPFYSTFPTIELDKTSRYSFATFLVRAIVSAYLEKAAKTTNQKLKAYYYLFAFVFQHYLPSKTAASILNELEQFSTLPTTVSNDLTALIKKDKAGKAGIADWDGMLQETMAIYTVSSTLTGTSAKKAAFSTGPQLYRKCLQAYIDAEALQQLSDAERSLRQAFLYYRFYLLIVAAPEKQDPSKTKVQQQITTLLGPWFSQGVTLAKAMTITPTDSQDSYVKAIAALKNLFDWQQTTNRFIERMAFILEDQKTATPKVALTGLDLLTKKITTKDTTYASAVSKTISSVTIGDVTLQLASVSEKYGNWAVKQATYKIDQAKQIFKPGTCSYTIGFHSIAARAFSDAVIYYIQAGNAQKANTVGVQASVEKSIAQADLIGNAVIGLMAQDIFKTFLPADIMVYARYLISPLILSLKAVPPVVPSGLASSFAQYQKNKSDSKLKAAVEDDLRTVAAALYLYLHLNGNGLSQQFENEGNDYVAVIQNPAEHGGLKEDSPFTSYVDDARAYKKSLETLMDTGFKTDKETIKTELTYYAPKGVSPALVYCNLPMLPAPETGSKAIDPSAAMAYLGAFGQYQQVQGGSDQQRKYAQKKMTMMQTGYQEAYLSFAASLILKAQYMNGTAIDKTVIDLMMEPGEETFVEVQKKAITSVLTNPKSVSSLDDKNAEPFVKSIGLVEDYFNLATVMADGAANGSKSHDIAGLPGAYGVLGFVSESYGDFLVAALIGDPKASTYKQFVQRALKLYGIALGTFKKYSLPESYNRTSYKIGKLFDSVANAFVAHGDYLEGAISYNKAAAQYKSVVDAGGKGVTDNLNEAMFTASLRNIVAAFYGATKSLNGFYTDRWAKTITVKYNGQSMQFKTDSKTSAFEKLREKARRMAPYLAGGQAVRSRVTNVTYGLLDAIIFYASVIHTLAEYNSAFKLGLKALAAGGGSSYVGTKMVKGKNGDKNGAPKEDPAIKSYIAKEVPSKKGLAGALTDGSIPADKLTEVLNTFVLQGKDFNTVTVSDAKSLGSIFERVQKWALKVNVSLNAVYINTFKAPCQESAVECVEENAADLQSALQARAQSLASPAKQYFGG